MHYLSLIFTNTHTTTKTLNTWPMATKWKCKCIICYLFAMRSFRYSIYSVSTVRPQYTYFFPGEKHTILVQNVQYCIKDKCVFFCLGELWSQAHTKTFPNSSTWLFYLIGRGRELCVWSAAPQPWGRNGRGVIQCLQCGHGRLGHPSQLQLCWERWAEVATPWQCSKLKRQRFQVRSRQPSQRFILCVIL